MKTAIVSGASRGIGAEIARALLEAGYNVVAAARNRSIQTEELQREYADAFTFVTTDLSREDDRDRLISTAIDQYGKVDLLVNNAGVAPPIRKDMMEITQADYDYVMDINLKGTYFLTQAAATRMIERGGGCIINIGSISADTVSVNRAEYCLSKAGVRMMTQLFALRLASEAIGVFEISPGVIDTDMISGVKADYERLASQGSIPARRLGKPEDIAKAVIVVASGALDYATGTVIHCGGGLHIKTL